MKRSEENQSPRGKQDQVIQKAPKIIVIIIIIIIYCYYYYCKNVCNFNYILLSIFL
jgi:type III secretory pathway component EscS